MVLAATRHWLAPGGFWLPLHQGQSARSWTQLYYTVPQPNLPVFDSDLAGDLVFLKQALDDPGLSESY